MTISAKCHITITNVVACEAVCYVWQSDLFLFLAIHAKLGCKKTEWIKNLKLQLNPAQSSASPLNPNVSILIWRDTGTHPGASNIL